MDVTKASWAFKSEVDPASLFPREQSCIAMLVVVPCLKRLLFAYPLKSIVLKAWTRGLQQYADADADNSATSRENGIIRIVAYSHRHRHERAGSSEGTYFKPNRSFFSNPDPRFTQSRLLAYATRSKHGDPDTPSCCPIG